MNRSSLISGAIFLVVLTALVIFISRPRSIILVTANMATGVKDAIQKNLPPARPTLDKAAYDAKLLSIANLPLPKVAATSTTASSTSSGAGTTPAASSTAPATPHSLWPVKTVYPNGGALLPFQRIVAYYGNLYSKQMGVLGQYPENQMLGMLSDAVQKWQAADPGTPTIPALDYIVVTAQGSPGPDGKYRFRMPASEIDKVIAMADKVHGLVFLDVQVGLSNVRTEIPLLADYLKLPQVHLALDPEFSMKTGAKPGTVIGTMDANDIDYAANFLADLVRQNNLPPKILVVHRFTQPMVTNYKQITPLPEVQIVMDADGFGAPPEKIRTYRDFIASEPVQFTGFKLFYKNDPAAVNGHLMTPAEVLKLSPRPSYIQYQ